MKRLFVKVKTNPKLVGTLLEINGESTVHAALDAIVGSMEGLSIDDKKGQKPDYRLVRLGSPNRALDNQQTFGDAHIQDGDILLLIPGADIETIDGRFNFEPLSIIEQDISIQDLRAPIKSPQGLGFREKSTTPGIGPTDSALQAGAASEPTVAPSGEENPKLSSMGFQALEVESQSLNKPNPELPMSIPPSSRRKRKKNAPHANE